MMFRLCWIAVLLVSAIIGAPSDLAGRIREAQSAGDFRRAADLYAQLIAAGEDTPEIRSNAAAMLHLAGDDTGALAQARRALAGNAGLTGANLIAGLALTRLGRPREAISYLECAHRADPRGPAPLLSLGQVYVSLRDYARSNAAYREAAKLDKRSAEAWYGVGITYRSLADSAMKGAPRGVVPQEAQRFLDSALEALTNAVALQPDSPRAHLILAESFRDCGKFVDAVAQYTTLLTLTPGDTAAELGLATTYWKAGELDNALPALREVLRKLPNDPEANGILADILVRRGKFALAATHARTALAGNPSLAQVRAVLAKVYLAENNPVRAIEQLEKAAPADPDGSYHYLLHRALRLVGRDAEAATALKEFKRLRAASSIASHKAM